MAVEGDPEAEAREARSKARASLRTVLSGETPIALNLEFLYRSNRTDQSILTAMKKVRRAPPAPPPPSRPPPSRRPCLNRLTPSPPPPSPPQAVEQRNSVYHSGIVLAHALMSAGTTSDAFLRDNLEWLSRATNWAKFSATATLGVIHKGHVKQALQLLQPYLPQAGMSASAYSEGGALFALGIIHANHGTEIRSYLLDALRNAGTNEVVQHGAALGIGIAAMGTEDDALYEELKVHCRAILRNSAQFWRNSGAILRNSL